MTKLRMRMTDIGCLIRISDDPPQAAYRQAIIFAADAGAHLTVIIGVQTFIAPYTPFGTSMASSLVGGVNDKAEAMAASLADTIRSEAAAAGVVAEIDIVAGPFAEVAERAANAARSVDLVVVDQPHGALDTSEMLLEEALFHSGRPVFVASAKSPPRPAIRRIIVGWDGSEHAVRAVSDALFVFPTIEHVEIVTVSGEKSLAHALPAADFARHLARKGVETTLTDVESKDRSVAAVLDDYAVATKADVLVTGAFGHSRLREFLLGGVTVELTDSAATSLLMSY